MEVKVLQNILQANDAFAEENRRFFREKRILVLNVMGSPGSGKTTLIEKTIRMLEDRYNFAVIEGDVASTIDADKLSKLDIPVAQINTEPFGGACHLEANWIRQSTESFDLDKIDMIFIENVGNLVCPAEFDTGAHKNIVILSIPEGEDKPAKYPLMFRVSHAMVISKLDLIDAVGCDMELLHENLKKVNDGIIRFKVSSKSGEGFDDWLKWVQNEIEGIKK
ncbi:hydrogenase nickel incorporation protein HypB [bacterium]|nr:hydrogenase nickel incorporation protein HypB [bacterium]